MTFKITCSQGRVGDRTERMIRGAKLTAEALAQRYQTTPTYVGTPSPAKADDWTIALAEAASTLDHMVIFDYCHSGSLISTPILTEETSYE